MDRALADRFGPGWHLRRVYHRIRPAGVQQVYQATSAQGQRLAIKICATPETTRAQFDALVLMARAQPDSVTPRFIAADDGFFAMDWIEAPTLKDRLGDAERLKLLHGAGRWLRRLHAATRALRPRTDAGPRGDLLYPGQGAEYNAVLRELTQRQRRLRMKFAWISLLHGDFHPGNLFVDAGRIVCFDPPQIRYGPRHVDLARFLVLLRVYRQHAQALGRAWPDSYRQDEAAFLGGYGALYLPLSGRLRFMVDLATARLWHHLARQPRLTALEQAELAMLHRQMARRGLLPEPG
ncbi:phosphotransferase [Paracoccus sp. (in: a-proteobacteria)]|uniref:phosphotransferase n=1 Tax=Paracoccus sp. TaxID=267 RepID=UPI0026DFDC30|nr:phosphotransferase [Paracoccus sp. (in: a-proteobacteria)]